MHYLDPLQHWVLQYSTTNWGILLFTQEPCQISLIGFQVLNNIKFPNLHHYFSHLYVLMASVLSLSSCRTFNEVVLQNITNRTCLVYVKSEKYTFLVTHRPMASMRRGESKPDTFHYQVRGSQSTHITTQFSVSSPP